MCCLPAAAAISLCFGEEETRPSKRKYNLFNPVPRPLLRELESDRPDRTESAYTVDAGHFQLEMDAFALTKEQFTVDGTYFLVKHLAAPSLNLKLGILNRMDLQLVVPAFNRLQLETRGAGGPQSSTESGAGDIRLRTKVNLWGNDGGRSALSVMPFVQFPTGTGELTSGTIEGGIILPFALELPAGFDLGIMEEIDFLHDDSDGRANRVFVQSVAFGHDILRALSGYVEFFSAVDAREPDRWVGTVDGGVNWLVLPDFKLDAGVNLGVTRTASDWTVFVGLTWRR